MLAVYARHDRGAVDAARAGRGPQFIECKTYRMAGHAAHDKYESYMPMELLAEWSDKDPLKRLEHALLRGAWRSTSSGWRASATASATRCAEAVERADDDEYADRRGGPLGVFAEEAGGRSTMPELTYLEAIRAALHDEMEVDERVFCMGEDVGRQGGAFGATKELQQRFGELRSIDTPVAESGIVGVAVGAAMAGQRPSPRCSSPTSSPAPSTSWSPAPPRCTTGSAGRCRMVVRCPNGGGVGGGPYHSENVEAWFHHHAGLKIVCPATATDAYGLLRAAIRDPNPVVFCEHKFLYRRVKEDVATGPRTAGWCRSARPASRRPGSDL